MVTQQHCQFTTAPRQASATITKGTNNTQTTCDMTRSNKLPMPPATISTNQSKIAVPDTVVIPTYGPLVFPSAVQILPMHPLTTQVLI